MTKKTVIANPLWVKQSAYSAFMRPLSQVS